MKTLRFYFWVLGFCFVVTAVIVGRTSQGLVVRVKLLQILLNIMINRVSFTFEKYFVFRPRSPLILN